MIPDQHLDRLPVRTALPALREALTAGGTAVLAAPPGTGKTTAVPLALAGSGRRVLVAEPRRIAARAAARRMAWMLGEPVGRRVGFTVRGERRAGPQTVVEVVTTGVLLQRLQRDQDLPGVDLVMLDECHERHLDADTATAFLLDVRAALRPGLALVAASATTDTEGWARLLDAPVVTADGTAHPVEVVRAPPPRPVRPPHGTRVDPALLDHVAHVIRRSLREREGDVLCFLPGVGEIGRVAGLLAGGGTGPGGTEVLRVHGQAPAAVQDAVLAGTDRDAPRRVVLATAVAESSLTVPGVRVVVDAGLAREPRTDHARGLSALTTVRVSRAAAEQRAGRAGREAPGTVYRCWDRGEDARLPRQPAPEISVADLTSFALHTACWGDPDASGLALLDPPPEGAMAAARATLRSIGATAPDGRITPRGEQMARIGLHPRLARALLDGAGRVGARRAAEVVALLSEEPPREWGDDLALALRAARRGNDPYTGRWRAEVRRLCGALEQTGGADTGNRVSGPRDDDGDTHASGLVAALAFPERVAGQRGGGSLLMVSGTRAELAEGSALRNVPWLAVAVADRPVQAASARVRLAAVIDEETARWAAAPLVEEQQEVFWSDARRDVVARRVERIGAVELREHRLDAPDPARLRAALLEGLRREGIAVLRPGPAAEGLRQRMSFLHRVLGDPWPEVSDAAVTARAGDLLVPGARRRADLERLDVHALLTGMLPWTTGEAARLEDLAPERIEVPSGSRITVDYSGDQPVLAVKLQELFGLDRTPRIAGGRVPVLLHLLSPAGRPAAVTADLESFWREGYRAVRAELRGRYPRHSWPQDPGTARPTRRTNARRS